MCLTEPGARVTFTLLVDHSLVRVPRLGQISDNTGRKGATQTAAGRPNDRVREM